MILSSAAVPPSFLKLGGTTGGPGGFLRGLEPRLAEAPGTPVRQREQGLEFLLRRVQEQLGPAPRVPEAYAAARPLPTARETADNILGFVRSRLQQEAALGADPERLQGLLQAARDGFERGYRQALGELEALGVLNEELAADLTETRDLVRSGLDGMEPGRAGETVVAAPVRELASYQRQVRAVETESLQLEVRTRDGDRVRIQLESVDAFRSDESILHAAGAGGSLTQAQFSASRLSSERFSIRIEGNLDEDERAALEDLLGRVDRLADQFFDGDAQLALQQALELGYDRDEIAGFSLRLTATDVRQVSETYRRVQALGDGPELPARGASELAQLLRPLGQFLQSVRASEQAADALGRPGQLLRQLLEGTLSLVDTGEPLLAADRALLDLIGDGEDRTDDDEMKNDPEPALNEAA